MKNQFFTILAASTISLLLCSCSGPLQKTGHGFLYNGGTAVIKVECYTPSSIRVVKAAPGETPVPNDFWSLAAKPEKAPSAQGVSRGVLLSQTKFYSG